MNVLDASGEGVYEGVRNHAEHNAVRNGIRKRHGDHAHECGDSFAQVAKVNFSDGCHHDESDQEQGGCRCKTGDGEEYRSKKQGQQEEETDGYGGKAGFSTEGHTGGTFYVGGGGRGAHDSACCGGDSVSRKGSRNAGELAFFGQESAAE